MFSETTYNVHVKTGDVKYAGTDANVHLQIYGSKGDTGELHLRQSENHSNKFERGKTDHFKLEATDIGKVFWLIRTVDKNWKKNVDFQPVATIFERILVITS